MSEACRQHYKLATGQKLDGMAKSKTPSTKMAKGGKASASKPKGKSK